MAARYWVGGTDTWDGTVGTKWSTSSGGAGGAAVPTAADDVYFDGNSGAASVTVNNGAVAQSITCTGFTGSLLPAASATITVGGTSSGGLTFVAGMTFTANSSTIVFASGGGATYNLTSGGKSFYAITVNTNTTTTLQFQDAVTCTGTVTLTQGKLDTNNQTCSWGLFSSSNSNTRTVTLGASNITCTADGGYTTIAPWDCSTSTNLTLNANTSSITLNGTNGVIFRGGYKAYNNVSLTGSGKPALSQANTFANLTRTGTALKTDDLQVNANQNITGTLTLTGNSVTNRLMCKGYLTGTAQTLTAAAVSLTNVDFMDITGAGAAAPFTGTSLGDCGGNSGITFDASVAQTWSGTSGGNWSTNAWTTRVPLPQDDVTINNAFTAGQTITQDMPRAGRSITFTSAITNSPAFTISSGLADWSIYGSLTLVSQVGAVTSNSKPFILRGRGSHQITFAGKSVSSGAAFRVYAFGGTYTMQDAGNGSLELYNGTFDANGYNYLAWTISVPGTGIRSLIMGTGTWTLSGNSLLNMVNVSGSGYSVSAASTTIVISAASTATRTFIGGGQTYGTLTYTVANSPGSLNITGANTFYNLNIGSGRTVTMPTSTVQTMAGDGYLRLPGTAGNYASTPDSVPLSITGDIDVRCKVAMNSWANGSTDQTLIAKAGPTSPDRTFMFRVKADGKLNLYVVGSWGAANLASTVATGFVAGSTHWVRATCDVDDGAANSDTRFYTSDDGVTWIQLGTTVNTGWTIPAFYDTTFPLEVGSWGVGTQEFATGCVHRAQVYSGIVGTLVFDADFSGRADGTTSFTESSANAATVTVNGASSYIYANGTGTFNAQGTNNGYLSLPGVTPYYVSAPDSAALSIIGDQEMQWRIKFTALQPSVGTYLGAKWSGVAGGNAWRFWIAGSGGFSWADSVNGTNAYYNNSLATNAQVIAALTTGVTYWVRVTVDVDNGSGMREIKLYYAADSTSVPTSWTQLGTTLNSNVADDFTDTDSILEIGSFAGGNSTISASFYRFRLLDGIGGTVAFDADFTTKPVGANTFTESSANAATVTINGTLAKVGDGRVSLVSSTPGTPATLSKSSGTVTCNYLSIQDSAATGGAGWYAGAQSTNVSGNSGWIFTAQTGIMTTSKYW